MRATCEIEILKLISGHWDEEKQRYGIDVEYYK